MTSTELDARHLEQRLERMREAIRTSPMEIPASLSIASHEALDEVAERLALGVDHTVVAFFGGTGSGKSSLFNAVTQLDFADVGARRPTTSRAAACTWGDDATALLDFLGVDDDRRIRRESLLDADDQEAFAGLVLLDVPDYDSVTTAHALQVDRLVPLADILVWVVDPQKYADAALHEGYLRGLGARQEDMIVLVNQIETVPDGGQERLVRDVRELLDADGLTQVEVLPVSAKRGDNIAHVRDLIRERVARESNAARTAHAELNAIARRLSPTVAREAVDITDAANNAVLDGLMAATGATAVSDAIRVSLASARQRSLTRCEPPARVTVRALHSTWLHTTCAGLPQAWMRSVVSAIASPEALTTQCAEAVSSVPLPAQRKPVLTIAWALGILAALVGAVVTVSSVFTSTAAHTVVGVTLLLVGLVVMVGTAQIRRARAQRESLAYADGVHSRLSAVVSRGLIEPTRAILDRHAQVREALSVQD